MAYDIRTRFRSSSPTGPDRQLLKEATAFILTVEQINAEVMMKSDSELERDVKEELKWNPDLDATDIAVSAHNGAVTLTGFVRSYTDKYEAERATKRVAGVIAVANDLEVRIPSIHQRPDPDIARDAAAAIKNYVPISYERIKAVVKDGWVTLEGDVRMAVPAAGSGNCSSPTTWC